MIKPKIIIISGASGFFLSFLVSIISTHSFGHSLFRGLIFGTGFALLAVLISFINSKLLDGEGSGSALSEGTEGFNSASGQGGKVDITLSDDNLTNDGDDLKFRVSDNRQAMDLEEVKSRSKSDEIEDAGVNMEKVPVSNKSMSTYSSAVSETVPDNSAGFTPVQLGTKLDSVASDSSSGSVIKAASEEKSDMDSSQSRKAQAKAEREENIKMVDELPDIGTLAPVLKSEEDGDIVEDSDFASAGVDDSADYTEYRSSGSVEPQNHDAETMAKAIRTLLKKED